MTDTRYAAIILAAGLSSRMKSFKPLLPLGAESIADRVISSFTKNSCDVLLVIGWNKDLLLSGLKTRYITIVENPDYEQGMFTSVLAGIHRLQPQLDGFFIMPVDIPLVRPATVRGLMDEAAKQPGKIIYPAFGRERGHPTFVPSCLVSGIASWQQDGGLKAFLRIREELSLDLPVPDRNILFDIDTADDYQEAQERFRTYDIPTDEECDVIMDVIHPVATNVRRHCRKVAEVAVFLGEKLRHQGQDINLPLVRAAALLHDLAKGMPDHDTVAGRMLNDMGFGAVGNIVALHTDLTEGAEIVSLETKIVYLADKFVENDKIIPLEERYRTWDRRFAVTPDVKVGILRRKSRALQVKQELEVILGGPLENIINV
ncbi:MAG: NTP transferase domain-containing protein [Deltaproteobacteria bacterium]|nr:NTP transferase domain-containing protein [Deltaproteobacteria bacterium]